MIWELANARRESIDINEHWNIDINTYALNVRANNRKKVFHDEKL
jgi:hypothetical protein